MNRREGQVDKKVAKTKLKTRTDDGIEHEGAMALSEALRENTTLQNLYLSSMQQQQQYLQFKQTHSLQETTLGTKEHAR